MKIVCLPNGRKRNIKSMKLSIVRNNRSSLRNYFKSDNHQWSYNVFNQIAIVEETTISFFRHRTFDQNIITLRKIKISYFPERMMYYTRLELHSCLLFFLLFLLRDTFWHGRVSAAIDKFPGLVLTRPRCKLNTYATAWMRSKNNCLNDSDFRKLRRLEGARDGSIGQLFVSIESLRRSHRQ